MAHTPHHHDSEQLLAQLGWVKALAHRLVVDPNVADDVLQRVCLLALENPPRDLSGEQGLRRWLSSATRRLVHHSQRSQSRRARRERGAARPEELPSTATVAERRELMRTLVDALTGLDEPYFTVLTLRYFDGLTIAEIATREQVSRELVRTRLSRGRTKLRARLQPGEGDDRERWLAALGPMAISTAFVRDGAHLAFWKNLGGFVMAQTPSVLALKAALGLALVAVVALTAWNALDEPAAPSTAAPLTLPATSSAPPDALDGHLVSDPGPSSIQMPLVAPPATAPEHAELLAEPIQAIDRELVLNQLFNLTSQLALGELTADAVLDLSLDMMALLEDAAEPEMTHGGNVAKYTLLESNPGDHITLSVREADVPGGVPEFRIEADLKTLPGFITGSVDDGTTSTTVGFDYYLDRDSQLSSMYVITQALTKHSEALADESLSRGRLPGGGALRVEGGETKWQPLWMQYQVMDDGEISWMHTIGDAVIDETGLDPQDARSQRLAKRLADARNR